MNNTEVADVLYKQRKLIMKQINIDQYLESQPYYNGEIIINMVELDSHHIQLGGSFIDSVKHYFSKKVITREIFFIYEFHNDSKYSNDIQPDKLRIIKADIETINNNSCGYIWDKTWVETNTFSFHQIEDIEINLIISKNRDQQINKILNEE